METEYSKREIDIFMKEIRETLDRIEIQTTKTNGSVKVLNEWMSFSKGAISILTLLVVPVLLYLLYIHIAK